MARGLTLSPPLPKNGSNTKRLLRPYFVMLSGTCWLQLGKVTPGRIDLGRLQIGEPAARSFICFQNNTFSAGSYTLSFLLGGNQRGAPAQTTTVSLGTFLQNITLNSTDPLALFSFSFFTTGGVLSFLEQGPSDQQGNILDEVSLSTVPLPASWNLMLLGLIRGFAFFQWRGRKRGSSFSAA